LDEYGKDMTGINTGKEELWTGMMIGLANERMGKEYGRKQIKVQNG
jgi:hypothetical protein